MSEITSTDIKLKIEECANFLNSVLRPEYERFSSSTAETERDIEEYKELQQLLLESQISDRGILEVLDTERVDLGHGKVFANACLDSPHNDFVFVQIGKGFHVELTLLEAQSHLKKRIEMLSCDVVPYQKAKVGEILDHIRTSELLLDQLTAELMRM